MNKLIFVTILWAFSFSLIGEFLAGKVDSYLAVFVRVTLASLVFLPFTKFRGVSPKLALGINLDRFISLALVLRSLARLS